MGSIGGGAGEQQYSLRWNDFHSSLVSSFRHLRDQQDFVDVTLACDGRSFTAHKVVLSACSPYFRTLLKANPCQHPIVILRDVKEHDMEALLRFMYNGEVHIGQEQLADFLKTAQTLQVRGLADVPSKEQEKLLNVSHSPVPPTSVSGWPPREGDSIEGELSPPAAKRPRPEGDRPDRPYSPTSDPSRPDTILSHALDPTNNNTVINNNNQLKGSDSSLAAETGEESNSSELSERVDVQPKSEPQDYSPHSTPHATPHSTPQPHLDPRQPPPPPPHNFPAALLGLQGIPGLLPGPSGMHNSQENSFGSRRSVSVTGGGVPPGGSPGLELMRVRATDPRPCPKCGKIYRSAHTLRTHLEDKHTVCPGYRCVLCGTVAKSRNSLHSHMSRQHRGISTKDLPVLPMPSPFDPELASRLLAKAGVKVSAAELRARSSPTGLPRRPELKLDLKPSSDDPEDLTVHSANHVRARPPPPSYPAVDIRPLSPGGGHGPAPSTGSAILDTYLQFIAENSATLQLEHAKMAKEDPRRYLEDPSDQEEDDYSDDETQPQPIKAE